MTVFRKVSPEERLPEPNKVVIGITSELIIGDIACSYTIDSCGNWFSYPGDVHTNEPDYWLEEVPVPSTDEINAEADRQFAHGRSAEADGFVRCGEWMINQILRKLI